MIGVRGKRVCGALLIISAACANLWASGLSTELAQACKTGDFGKAMSLINDMADVNGVTLAGSTPLIDACRAAQLAAVMFLVMHKADVNQRASDTIGTTPLIASVRSGDVRVVRFILSRKARVNDGERSGMTALTVAAQMGDEELVEVLLEDGADVEGKPAPQTKGAKKGAVDAQGFGTPLILAVEQGHIEVAQILIQKGANVNQADAHGRTPLMFAALLGDLELVQFLIKRGADAKALDKRGRSAVDYALTLASPAVSFYLTRQGAPAPLGAGYTECRGLYRCSIPTAAFGAEPHYVWFQDDGAVYALSSRADDAQLQNVVHINNPRMAVGTWTIRGPYLYFSIQTANQGTFYMSASVDDRSLVNGETNDGELEVAVRSTEQWATFTMRYTFVDVVLYCPQMRGGQ